VKKIESRLAVEVNRINGQLRRSSVRDKVRRSSGDTKKGDKKNIIARRTLFRAAVACSLGLSIAGIMFSKSSSGSFDQLFSQLMEQFDHFKALF